MRSRLSLSDMELGMEEHAGDMDDVDYHKRKIKRRVSVKDSSIQGLCWTKLYNV